MDYTEFENLRVSEVVKIVEASNSTGELFRVEISSKSTGAKTSFCARYFERKVNEPNAESDTGENRGLAVCVEADLPWVDKQTADDALADALEFLEEHIRSHAAS